MCRRNWYPAPFYSTVGIADSRHKGTKLLLPDHPQPSIQAKVLPNCTSSTTRHHEAVAWVNAPTYHHGCGDLGFPCTPPCPPTPCSCMISHQHREPALSSVTYHICICTRLHAGRRPHCYCLCYPARRLARSLAVIVNAQRCTPYYSINKGLTDAPTN